MESIYQPCLLLLLNLLVLTKAVPPCDTAQEYLDTFGLCYSSDGNNTFLQIVMLNSIYSAWPEEEKDRYLAASYLNDSDSEGIKACGDGITKIRRCVDSKFDSCPASLQSTVEVSMNEFRAKFCENNGGTWAFTAITKEFFQKIGEAFTKLINDPTGEQGILCLTAAVGSGLGSENGTCLSKGVIGDIAIYTATVPYETAKDRLNDAYANSIKCLYSEMKAHGCTDDVSIGYLSYITLFVVPPGVNFGFKQLKSLTESKENPKGSERASVVVFGDPHMLSFDGSKYGFFTCSASEKTVLYFENGYVRIYGVNSAATGLGGFRPPTFMTQVFVEFLATDKTSIAVYNFTGGDSLPNTFDNGQTETDGGSGQNGGENGASVSAKSDSMVVLHLKRGGVVIAIKKIRYTLAMAVRMEKSLFVDAFGLLTIGCPGDEIDITVSRRKRQTSSETCSNLGLTGDYMRACTFDIDETGDDSLVRDQYESLEEIESAAEELDESIIEETESSASCVLVQVTTVCLIATAYVYIL